MRPPRGRSPPSRLEDATDPSNDSVSINDDSAIERRRIAHQLRRKVAQFAAHEQARRESLDRRDGSPQEDWLKAQRQVQRRRQPSVRMSATSISAGP